MVSEHTVMISLERQPPYLPIWSELENNNIDQNPLKHSIRLKESIKYSYLSSRIEFGYFQYAFIGFRNDQYRFHLIIIG